MTIRHQAPVESLVVGVLGEQHGNRAMRLLVPFDTLPAAGDGFISRAELAAALNIILFDDLLKRVPTGDAYVRDVEARGERVCFDHGALRTIRFAEGPTGALPAGEGAFRRLLEPLGYRVAGEYPLPKLRMTGRAYCHLDAPERLPQFFVSELHVERFDPVFADVAKRVFGISRDPLAQAGPVLSELAKTEGLPWAMAVRWLPRFAAAFDRQHDVPRLDDYRALAAHSSEAAWIATEGNAFNHATDRVADVDVLAASQKALGRQMKDQVEVSASGRVRQTAFHADPIVRDFACGVRQPVPGSFYEFITRDMDSASGRLDLAFDSGNASGIFAMTAATL
ncbi:MAG: hypothetical protein JWR80_10119 [Bradyrhizobium sp.]|nr:hypothetical protein [Bradyrhizobium sp.]